MDWEKRQLMFDREAIDAVRAAILDIEQMCAQSSDTVAESRRLLQWIDQIDKPCISPRS
jgi:predicted dithiol-disulfide oxidoreductase (DUF899 family)